MNKKLVVATILLFLLGLPAILYLNVFFNDSLYLPFVNIYYFSIYGFLAGLALYFIIIKPSGKKPNSNSDILG